MKLLAASFLVALALTACKKDPPATGPDNTGGDDTAVDDRYACTVADDCVAVELGCCDACNGGEAVGVHQDHVDEVVADSPRGRGECQDMSCTEMGCAPWVPSCEAGTCAITRGSFE